MLLHSQTKVLGSKQWYAAKRFYEACKIPICPASSLESSWQSLCVRASLVSFQSSIILDRSVSTNERAPICVLDQWEMSKILLTIVWGEPWQQWRVPKILLDCETGASSESNPDPFPAWSSHSLLVKLSQMFWPMSWSDSQPLANQRTGNLVPVWGGNDVWDVHTAEWAMGCMQQGRCRLCRSEALMWNMFVSSLAALSE